MKSPQSATDNPLTDRHERFVHEYLIDQNASAAAGRAGYSARTKGTQAALMMKNPVVRARIVEELGALYASLKLNAVEVLRSQVRAAYLDPAKLFDAAQEPIPLDQLDEDTRGGLTVSYAKRRDGDYTMRVKQAPRHIALGILQKRLEAFERLQAEVFAEMREEAEQEVGAEAEAEAKVEAAPTATAANPPPPMFKLDFRLDQPPPTPGAALASADHALAEAAQALVQGGHTRPAQAGAVMATQVAPAEAPTAVLADADTPPPSPHEPGYDFKKASHGSRQLVSSRDKKCFKGLFLLAKSEKSFDNPRHPMTGQDARCAYMAAYINSGHRVTARSRRKAFSWLSQTHG